MIGQDFKLTTYKSSKKAPKDDTCRAEVFIYSYHCNLSNESAKTGCYGMSSIPLDLHENIFKE